MQTITQDFKLGEPQVAGPLAVFPIFGSSSRLQYRSFAQAAALNAFVKELDDGASVRELIIENPTDLPLLVYEGEEVLGAQQNRTFDTSVLIDAGARVRLPVSCVEHGRWDGRRSSERFTVAPQAADPSLRRVKRSRANQRASVGLAALPDQGEVWQEVGSKFEEHGAHSSSDALHDVYEARRVDLGRLTSAVRPLDGQTGAVAAVAGRPVALDLVSRADVFASLLPRLAQGYALDALESRVAEADADAAAAVAFLDAVIDAPREPLPTAGLGRGLRVDGEHLVGSGLEHEDELVALSAFPVDGEQATGLEIMSAPIARPSRRAPRRS